MNRPALVLLACALAAPLPAAGQAPSTAVLIDRALAAREISEEIAWKYRILALFGDNRLPAKYRGTGDTGIHPYVLDQAGLLLRNFSATTQAELAPFFARPAAPGSWVTLPSIVADPPGTPEEPGSAPGGADHPAGRDPGDTPWISIPAVGGKVRVWAQRRYPRDSAKAAAIATAMTSRIWPRLVGRFWEPLNDQRYQRLSVSSGQPEWYDVDEDNGGGPAFDIYLVHYPPGSGPGGQELGGAAHAADRPWHCGQNPRYITLESRRPLGGPGAPGILNTLAHELMHAISHARWWKDQDCANYNWVLEATGTWAEDFVYPDAQSEQPRAPDYLRQPYLSLDDPGPLPTTGASVTDRMYGTYLLPFYLARFGGQEAAIPRMWEQFATQDPLPGINAALAGTDLEHLFPRFAVANWNQPSVDGYEKKDRLTEHASLLGNPIQVSTPGGTVFSRDLPVSLHYLAAKYYHFRMDPSVRSVTFTNGLFGHPNASVWGIEKIKGTWKDSTDWTGESGVTWCRNVDEEDLEELVIIFVDKAWPRTPADRQQPARLDLKVDEQPVLKAYPTGCNAWVGTITASSVQEEPGLGLRETTRSTVRFVVDSSMILPGQPPEYWKATRVTIQWTARATGARCSGSHAGTYSMTMGADDNPPSVLRIWAPEDGGRIRYSAWQGPPLGDPLVTYQCDGPPLTMHTALSGAWMGMAAEGHQMPLDGKSLTDRYLLQLTPETTIRYSWSFRPGP